MTFVTPFFLSLLLCWQSWASTARSPIWPQPSHINLGEDILWVDKALTATFYCGGAASTEALFAERSPGTIRHYAGLVSQAVTDGTRVLRRILQTEAQSSTTEHPEVTIPEQDIVRQAVRQALAEIQGSNFVPWKFHKRHSSFEPDDKLQQHRLTSLTIKQWICPIRLVDPLSFHGGHEEYGLKVENGSAFIESASSVGTMRALGEFHEHRR